MRFVRRPIAYLLLMAVAGCASAPIVETKAFSDSVSKLNTAGSQLFSDIALMERKVGRSGAIRRAGQRNSIIKSKNGIILTRLDPNDAPYFATIGDPPAVKVFKHSFAVIVAYADTLTALSDGRDAAAVQGQVSQLAHAVDTLGTALAFLPPPATALAALAPVVTEELKPVIGQVLAAQSVEEAKSLVARTAEPMRHLIGALRDAAPAMVEILSSDAVAALEAAAKAKKADDQPATAAAAYVTQVANYVVLLDQLREAFDTLVLAYEHPENAVNLALVVQRSNELSADVDAFQRTWSAIRNRL